MVERALKQESQTIKQLNGKLPHSETVDAVPTSETTEQSDGERRLACQGLTLASNDPRSQISRHNFMIQIISEQIHESNIY